MKIGFLHTAALHEATFERLLTQAAPQAQARHHTDPQLLAQAQSGARPDLAPALKALSDCDAVLCTCSTLGPLAEAAGMVRIDRPLAQAAAQRTRPLIAYCVESTRAPTQALMDEEGARADYRLCPGWDAFLSGNTAAYAAAIATDITAALSAHDAIILAQASMAVAAPLLASTGLPVLTSPPLAIRAVLRAAQ